MANARFSRMFAAPIVSVAILGGALGFAGLAHADSYSDDPAVSASSSGIIAVPSTYAEPAATVESWGQSLSDVQVNVPRVDTTVYQSR